jgi:RimJ/RimL family protein N-acetyltransferase
MNILEEILNDEIIIETERLRIYPFIVDSKILTDLYLIYSDSINIEYYCSVYDDFNVFSNYMRRKIQEHQIYTNGIISFIIELKENSRIIGLRNVILDGVYTRNGYKDINNENLITEILLNKNYWQKGIATEASFQIFNFLKSRGVVNVLSFIDNRNHRAKQLDKKLKFQTINYQQAICEFDYHKDFIIHTRNIDDCEILLKIL